MADKIENKTILILGGSGSLGNMLTKRFIERNIIYIYSRSENTQWLMKQKFNHKNLHFFIGDIRDSERLQTCLYKSRANIIIIAAALKHIDVCEESVNESINTNITGIRNVADLIANCHASNNIPYVESVLFVSTDKACSPVNVYGMCKAISERIIIEKSTVVNKPKFINVRYGNVISSRGSIIPFFRNIANNDKCDYFPLTDENMTRYFMTLDQSVDLIEYALLYGLSGETIVPKHILSHKVKDIAELFSKQYNKPIKIVGIRPGEKIHETLISFTESLRTIERDNYYVIMPTRTKVENPLTFPDGEFNSKTTTEVSDLIKNEITTNE